MASTLDTYLPERRSLWADVALGETGVLESSDVGAPCMSFPYSCGEFRVIWIQHSLVWREQVRALKENSAQRQGFPEEPTWGRWACGGGWNWTAAPFWELGTPLISVLQMSRKLKVLFKQETLT